MGQAIVYCGKCQVQLRGADFEKGAAFHIKGQGYCKKCARDLVAANPAELLDPLLKQAEKTPPGGSPVEKRLRVAPVAPPRESGGHPGLIAAAAGAVALLAAAILVATRSGKPSEEEVVRSVPPPVELPLPRSAEPPRREEVPREPPPKPVEPGPSVMTDLGPLDEKVAAAADAEEFAKALLILDEARKRHSREEWGAAVEKRIADVRDRAARQYGPLREKALDARRRGAAAEVRALRERVAAWGMPALAADLEKALAEAEPPPAPTEAETYRASWLAAVGPASGRDYAAAIGELERLSQGLKDASLKSEAAADLQSLRALQTACEETLQQLLRTPQGQKLAIGYFDETGASRRGEGTVARIDAQRIELKAGQETVVFPVGEILPASLAELIEAKHPKPLGMLLRALEGDREAAAAMGERFVGLAGRPGNPKEAEARRLFWTAERDTAVYRTAVDAVQAFARLLKEYGGTSFVRRNRAVLQARLEGGKEYFFFPDLLQAGGSFRSAKQAKVGPCWTSETAGTPGSMKDNFVELEFSVLPQTEYRCWAYVGGCCAETLVVHYQASDLKEPGSVSFAAAPHSISASIRRHASHGSKEPVRWGWVALPLPKSSAPGVKKVRLLTEQKGFSVACAIVSALKVQPPSEAEVREREKSRPPAPPAMADLRPVRDEGLVAHWTFDAGAGTTAADASKNSLQGVLVGEPVWVAGRSGKALQFDGVRDYVRVPDAIALTTKTGEFTASAWIFRKGEAPGAQPIIHRQRGGHVNDQYSLALPGGVPTFILNTTGGLRTAKGSAVPVRQWVHLAGSFDGTALRLFVNGAEVSADSGPAGCDLIFEDKPVTLAAAINDDRDRPNEFFQGLVDDVRIYHRALAPAEIGALAGR